MKIHFLVFWSTLQWVETNLYPMTSSISNSQDQLPRDNSLSNYLPRLTSLKTPEGNQPADYKQRNAEPSSSTPKQRVFPGDSGQKNYLAKSKPPLIISVFYESLCSDSAQFIIEQLTPTVKKLEAYLYVQLVPYGLAKLINSSIVCEHGVVECLGNTIEACAFKRMTCFKQKVDFAECIANSLKGSNKDFRSIKKTTVNKMFSAGEDCADIFDLNWDDLDECVNGLEGFEELTQLGKETANAHPPVVKVPTTIIGECELTEENTKSDFFGRVCSKLQQDGIVPPECNSAFELDRNYERNPNRAPNVVTLKWT